jgi:hypothetical protein
MAPQKSSKKPKKINLRAENAVEMKEREKDGIYYVEKVKKSENYFCKQTKIELLFL